MEVRQLRYFISAAEHMNFTRAAKECHIVQSSMTAQIANLEDELGVKLFERQSRGLVLTEEGSFFLPKAKELVAQMDKVELEVSSFRTGYRSVLRVGYSGELFKYDLVNTLKAYRKKAPQVKVLLHQLPEDKLLERLWEGLLDVILIVDVRFFAVESWIEVEPFGEFGPMLMVAEDHPLAGRKSVCMDEIKGLPFIIYDNSGRTELASQILSRTSGTKAYDQVWDHTSNEILVASGYGVSIWGERLCQKGYYPGLKFIKISDYPTKNKFMLAWRAGKCSAELKSFCEQFHKQFERDG